MPEVQIFEAVQDWAKTNSVAGVELDAIIDLVRFPLMTTKQLLDIVEPSGLVSTDSIFNAIREKDYSNSAFHSATLGKYFIVIHLTTENKIQKTRHRPNFAADVAKWIAL